MNSSPRIYTAILFFAVLIMHTAAQTADLHEPLTKKNGLRMVAGGNGIFLSAEYSRILTIRPDFFLEGSLGMGAIPGIGGVVIPHQITWNKGRKSSFLEAGVGGSYWTGKTDASGFTERDHSYSLSPLIGYRKFFGKERWAFRIFFTPLVHIAGSRIYRDWPVVPWAGMSLEVRF